MILVILAISIGLIVLGIWMGVNSCDCDTGEPVTVIGVFMLFAVLIAFACVGTQVLKLGVIDDKIAMYEEENDRIEGEIAALVEGYQAYESEIFTSVAPDSAMTLVALYPELKSDSLVQSQIDIYIANNEKIKALKEQKINGNVCRWWLYFGKLKSD